MNKDRILFLHGWLFDSRIWFGLDKSFSKKNKVTLIDLPGYGKNKADKSKAINYCRNLFSNQASPSVIISWSFGGLLSLLSLSEDCPFIKKVIIINSNLSLIDNSSEINLKNIKKMKKELLLDRKKALKRFFFECVKGSSKELKDYRLLIDEFKLTTLPNNQTLINGLDDMINFDFYNNLKDTQKEVVIISSSKDSLLGDKYYTEFKNKKNIKICSLDNIPHMPFISYKKEVVQIIKEFI